MYETVKVVKGYSIVRLIGSQRFYTVHLNNNRCVTFHTVKAAVNYIETAL